MEKVWKGVRKHREKSAGLESMCVERESVICSSCELGFHMGGIIEVYTV